MTTSMHALSRLDRIHAVDRTGQEYFGCDQNWYATEWQKMSGCGPSTAATILLYLQKSGQIDLPVHVIERKDCALLMDAVWSHVTPTPDGIYQAEQFCSGIDSFARAHGLKLACRSLAIPSRDPSSVDESANSHANGGTDRPSLAEAAAFIANGLATDSPIAFLNLCNGDVCNLEEWHWLTIVALEIDEPLEHVHVTVFDGDKSDIIDFKQWLDTTVDGGALIYLESPGVSASSNLSPASF